jgi:cyd operon protein YbgT
VTEKQIEENTHSPYWGETLMWYFAWILGVLLACAFDISNVMWLEANDIDEDQ